MQSIVNQHTALVADLGCSCIEASSCFMYFMNLLIKPKRIYEVVLLLKCRLHAQVIDLEKGSYWQGSVIACIWASRMKIACFAVDVLLECHVTMYYNIDMYIDRAWTFMVKLANFIYATFWSHSCNLLQKTWSTKKKHLPTVPWMSKKYHCIIVFNSTIHACRAIRGGVSENRPWTFNHVYPS